MTAAATTPFDLVGDVEVDRPALEAWLLAAARQQLAALGADDDQIKAVIAKIIALPGFQRLLDADLATLRHAAEQGRAGATLQ